MKDHALYLKALSKWVSVDEEIYKEVRRYDDRIRAKAQYHGQCVCTKAEHWKCNGECLSCEFHRDGDMLSLNAANDDGLSMLDTVADTSSNFEDRVCDADCAGAFLTEIAKTAPEIIQVGMLRLEGLTDTEIAKRIGINRNTLNSRIKKFEASYRQISSPFSI